MSDARPITDVTEFVCGACWNGFSREDLEVIQGSNVVCPHCGDVQAASALDSFAVVDAVRSAPAGLYGDDEAPEVAVGGEAAAASAMSAQPTGSTSGGDEEMPSWSVESTMHDFDIADGQGDDLSSGFGGVPERTDPDFSQVSDEPLPSADSEHSNDDQSGVADEAKTAEGETSLEWKVRASSGLTYNFHGVDALLRWSSSRELTEMELSVDGEQWCSLVVFANAARQGLSVQRALDLAHSGDPDLATADLAERPAAPDLFGMNEVELPEDGKKLKKDVAEPNQAWLDEALTQKEPENDEESESTSNVPKIALFVLIGLMVAVAALYFAGIDPLKMLP